MRKVYNQAIKDKIASRDDYPFGGDGFRPPKSRKAKKALSLSDIEKIYDYVPKDANEDWAKDMWLFAYFSNGLNVKDITLLRYKDIKEGMIYVSRAKTSESVQDAQLQIRVVITEDIQRIISKRGTRPTRPDNYVFGIISKGASELDIYRKVNQAIKDINKHMATISNNLKLSRTPTTNFARHSFSTVLKNAGVPIAMISEQLGHTNIATTQIYLSSFENDQLVDATRHLTAFKTKKEKDSHVKI